MDYSAIEPPAAMRAAIARQKLHVVVTLDGSPFKPQSWIARELARMVRPYRWKLVGFAYLYSILLDVLAVHGRTSPLAAFTFSVIAGLLVFRFMMSAAWDREEP